MSIIRFYSDPHFHHRSMAIKRGFSDELEMNEYIVQQWNKVVKKRDVTYLLGDITMEKNNYEILDRLNGLKKIVLGNHDQPQHVTSLLKYCNSVCASYKMGTKEFQGNIILTHIPIHESENDSRCQRRDLMFNKIMIPLMSREDLKDLKIAIEEVLKNSK